MTCARFAASTRGWRRLRLFGAFVLVLGTSWISRAAEPDQCKDVLREKVFKSSQTTESTYARQVLAARLSKMTKQEADQERGGSIQAVWKGIPVGAQYSESEFQSWQQQVQQSLNTTVSQNLGTRVNAGDPAGPPVVGEQARTPADKASGLVL